MKNLTKKNLWLLPLVVIVAIGCASKVSTTPPPEGIEYTLFADYTLAFNEAADTADTTNKIVPEITGFINDLALTDSSSGFNISLKSYSEVSSTVKMTVDLYSKDGKLISNIDAGNGLTWGNKLVPILLSSLQGITASESYLIRLTVQSKENEKQFYYGTVPFIVPATYVPEGK